MDIVVLDGYTLNPGDISWDGLASLGNLKVYDRTAYDISGANLIVERAKDADVVFTNKTPITREILARLPKLKFIGVLATGYNVVDLEAARERGIPVSNIPAYGTDAVAQMTIALLLEMCNHVGIHSESVFKGQWTNNEDFCYWNKSLIELAGKTMGIVGFGQIGQATANIALALGMDILVNSRSKMKELEGERVRFVDLETLFKDSDVISLHCPLTETNKGMINKGSISKMRDGVMIINTARGGLVVDEDLADALNRGKVAGAALDVVSQEPIPADNPLLKAKNCIITPHIAWAPVEARQRLMDIAVDNLRKFLEGNPINVVNK
ncbi:MAG: D-2-hydroxyacid dehydrogenase [Tissierellaceae bacterium]|jgi:glycerate dehydrogenase|nr:D-2-hydroxyacid dehydrogenase [Tissierellia bacterium]